MAIQVEFNYSHPSGTVPKIEDWVATLPAADQTAYAAAVERQNAIYLPVLGSGNLAVSPQKQVWQSSADMDAITNDPVWTTYFMRFIEENGITFSVDTKQV